MEGVILKGNNNNNNNNNNLWTVGKFLGKGAFGDVYVISNGYNEYAGKIIKKSKLSIEKKINEVDVHKDLNNKNIVNLITDFETPDYYVIVLDKCQHGDMKQLIRSRKRLTEPEVKYYALNIINGIEYLHSQHVVHRDIKLENILLCGDELTPKITDFGLARKLLLKYDCIKQIAGTPNYAAPEVLNNQCYSFSPDIWSYGALIYALLVGKPPFETNDRELTYRRIKAGVYYFPPELKISDTAKNFIKSILVVDINKRFTIEQIKNHPFLSRGFIPTSLPVSSLVIEPIL